VNSAGLLLRQALTEGELAAIRALAAVCEDADGHGIKLNWRMMTRRAVGHGGDCCWREGDTIVGYAPLDRFGDAAEVTVLVDPAYRRRGIGRALLEAAHAEARHQGCAELLLVNVRASATGEAFLAALGRTRTSSEYHLTWQDDSPPAVPPGPLTFRRAEQADRDFLTGITTLSFGTPEAEARRMADDDLASAEAVAFLALRAGQPVGRLSALREEGAIYLRSFGVLPDERGQGIGRALLAATIAEFWREGARQFALDVVTDNNNALSLYRSVGFREVYAYDYYAWPLC
jgi:ribosomal protein S18 acetylase RimI-like enzyme